MRLPTIASKFRVKSVPGLSDFLVGEARIEEVIRTVESCDLHILPYLGKLNWAEICAALGEIDYQGDFTYEVNGQLFLNCDEEFVPLGVGFMGTVGKHLCSMVEANRKTL